MKKSMKQIDNFIVILKSLFSGNDIVYISTPINTGERYIKWYSNKGKLLEDNMQEFNEQRYKLVVEPNIKYANESIKEIRKNIKKIVIDPTILENDILQWSQDEFYEFWGKVIKELISEIILLDGWEYSIGCSYEYLSAIENNVRIYSQDLKQMRVSDAVLKLKKSIKLYTGNNMIEADKLNVILDKILQYESDSISLSLSMNKNKMKDEKLDYLVRNNISNIAQYISFEPYSDLKTKFVHINNLDCKSLLSPKELVEKLISSAPTKSVNIRSFSANVTKGNTLVYNKKIEHIDEIIDIIEKNSQIGKHSIVNENISIYDSGVSGVALGNIIEFSPEDTPKCVDKEGVCSLPRDIGMKVLSNVYGFSPDIRFDPNMRVEFSIHPKRQGVKKEHTIIWEYEFYEKVENDKRIMWPNRFSSFIGDKLFGLLIADSLGLLVPRTTAITRKVAPFTFGTETTSKEKWIRTCPIVKEPGKYYTGSSWEDPFKLIAQEEEKGNNEVNIASILSQDSVEAVYSGASFVRLDEKDDLIEGVAGNGDDFMIGIQGKESLPIQVIEVVKNLNNQLRIYHRELGDVSFEWVFDGINVWIVQLNQLKGHSECDNANSRIIVQGNPEYYEKVFVKDGLDSLRNKIEFCKGKNIGIELVGNVGITSHFGDLLRLANLPSILSEK